METSEEVAVKRQGQIASKIADNTGKMTPLAFESKVRDWFKTQGRKMVNLCGDQKAALKLMTVAANEVTRNPLLMECEVSTFTRCLLLSAETGLFPGVMQECAYVPLRNKQTGGRLEANFWPMYQGLIKLAYQSGFLRRVNAAVVYEADQFSYELGSNAHIRHIPFLGPSKDRGARRCAWALAETIYGNCEPVVLSMDFIESVRKKSPGGRSDYSPWVEYYDAMASKTALKQVLKIIPKSTKLGRAIEVDGIVEGQKPKESTLEVSFVPESSSVVPEQQLAPPDLEPGSDEKK